MSNKPKSAGIMLYHIENSELRVFLVKPGGPYFRKKDLGSWTIPKGLVNIGEEPEETAKREFEEETGISLEGKDVWFIDEIVQKGGKKVMAFALEGNGNEVFIRSNTFRIEWPPRSGTKAEFPEVEVGKYFFKVEALRKINEKQAPLINKLENSLKNFIDG